MARHDFATRYSEADDPDVIARVKEVLAYDLGAGRVERAAPEFDKRGVDFWAYLTGSNRQGVDLKLRKRDWGDALLELVSRMAEETPGWSVNEHYITDYVLFLWPKRHLLLPYPQLRQCALRNLAAYRKKYGVTPAASTSETSTWRTENVAIPEGRLMFDMFGISLPGLPLTGPRACPSCREGHPVGTTCDDGWAPWSRDA